MREFGPDRPIYCIQAGILNNAPLVPSIDSWADEYLPTIQNVWPSGPYCLVGYSFGGILAHTLACKLQQASHNVSLLAILDVYPVMITDTVPEREAEVQFASNLHKAFSEWTGTPHDATVSMVIQRMTRLWKHSCILMSSFKPEQYRGDMILFTTPKYAHLWDTWRSYVTGAIHLYNVNCPHEQMCDPEPMALISRTLHAIKLT